MPRVDGTRLARLRRDSAARAASGLDARRLRLRAALRAIARDALRGSAGCSPAHGGDSARVLPRHARGERCRRSTRPRRGPRSKCFSVGPVDCSAPPAAVQRRRRTSTLAIGAGETLRPRRRDRVAARSTLGRCIARPARADRRHGAVRRCRPRRLRRATRAAALRARHADRLPGPVLLAQSAPDGRRDPSPSRSRSTAGDRHRSSTSAVADAARRTSASPPMRCRSLSARVQRRPAAADRHRPRAGAASRGSSSPTSRSRRWTSRSRRRSSTCSADLGEQLDLTYLVHLARSRRGPRTWRPGRGDVPGAAGRDRRPRELLRRTVAPLRRGAALRRPGAQPAGPARARWCSRATCARVRCAAMAASSFSICWIFHRCQACTFYPLRIVFTIFPNMVVLTEYFFSFTLIGDSRIFEM